MTYLDSRDTNSFENDIVAHAYTFGTNMFGYPLGRVFVFDHMLIRMTYLAHVYIMCDTPAPAAPGNYKSLINCMHF